MIRVVIDGKEVRLEKPTTILNAARQAGIDIPSLCYDERLQPYGACRLCLVEVKGRGIVTSCTTQVQDGMEVNTETPEVVEHRKTILGMLAERHPAGEVKGRLGELFKRYGISPAGAEDEKLVDDSHPWMKVDLNRCVLCYNCVRVCEGYIGRLIWRAMYRGQQTVVMPETGRFGTSSCISCRACVDVCPSGAIVDKIMDSARPTSWGSTACSMCSLSCPVRVGVQDGRPVYVEGDRDRLGFAAECLKGKYHWEDLVYTPERPQAAYSRLEGKWSRVSVDDAVKLLASELIKESREGGVGVVVSSRLTAEGYYLLQLFARAVLGTNNIDVAASLHGEPLEEAISVIGSPTSQVSLKDAAGARTYVVVGRLEDHHPALASMIRRRSLQGLSSLVLISDEDDTLANAADVHIAARGDGVITALQAIEAAAVQSGLASKVPPSASRAAIRARSARLQDLSKALGVRPGDLEEAARLISSGPTVAALELDGTPGVVTEVNNLLSMAGVLSLQGSGIIPLMTYYDNQEGIIFGVSPKYLPGLRSLDEASELEGLWGAKVPRSQGMGAAEMLEAAEEGRLRALLIVGNDLASPSPMREAILDSLYKVPFVAAATTSIGPTRDAVKLLVPLASHVEEEGTYVGVDGAATAASGLSVSGQALRAWELGERLLELGGYLRRFSSATDVWAELQRLVGSRVRR